MWGFKYFKISQDYIRRTWCHRSSLYQSPSFPILVGILGSLKCELQSYDVLLIPTPILFWNFYQRESSICRTLNRFFFKTKLIFKGEESTFNKWNLYYLKNIFRLRSTEVSTVFQLQQLEESVLLVLAQWKLIFN